MKYVEIDGKRLLWADVLKARREQREREKPAQLPLFELKEDARPQSQRTPAGRFEEPLLFPD